MRLPILMYHRLAEPRPDDPFAHLCTRPERFASHLALLARRRLAAVGAEALAAALDVQPAAPCAVLTFDDGTVDLADHLPRLLAGTGATAIIYLVAGLAGGPAAWLSRPGYAPPRLMDWTAARELAAGGIEFGGHTLTHPHLPALSRAEKEREIRDGKAMIEDRLGRPVRSFAYPFGDFDEESVAIAREAGFSSAVTVRRGSWHGHADRHRLRRVPVHEGVDARRLNYRLGWLYALKYRLAAWRHPER